jgi:hypothetical protein
MYALPGMATATWHCNIECHHNTKCSRVQLKCDGTRWRTVGEVKGNWRMEWVSSTLHTISEHGVSSITTITTADAHISAGSSRLNGRPRRFKWTRPFRCKTKCGFCACTITFKTQSTWQHKVVAVWEWRHRCTQCLPRHLTDVWSDSNHSRFTPGKESSAFNEKETRCAPELVLTFRRTQSLFRMRAVQMNPRARYNGDVTITRFSSLTELLN